MAERNRVEEEDEAAPAAKPKKSPIVMIAAIVVGALALAGASVGATLYLAGGSPPVEDEASEQDESDKPEKADKKEGKKSAKSKKKGKKDKDAKTEDKPAAVVYLPLDPPFVVNLQNSTEARFLQVNMEVMAREQQAVDDVKKHMPAIRNSLLMMLTTQDYETLSSAEGKEKIRASALAEIQKILNSHTGKPGVEQVYFTGFVMQ